jgi:iron-sulfur cluster repair protein YtfE (RIC family)
MSENGIDFLLSQHERIEHLLGAVQSAPADSRQDTFDELRELLAVHETAEELILRPVTRGQGTEGEQIADARFAEENKSKEVLAELEKLDVTSEEFLRQFESFAADVKEHAHNEETLEFPLVRKSEDEAALQQMGDRLQKAEKAAPTHPHPSAKTTAANVVLGPFAALLDKARDLLGSI